MQPQDISPEETFWPFMLWQGNIVGLTEIADKVTMGDLETSVSGKCVTSRDEIGDLARSLERMRSSLKAAMLRLGRETA
jgi:HAMP domain-containing protein